MKREDISDAMAQIGDDLLEEADAARGTGGLRRSRWRSWEEEHRLKLRGQKIWTALPKAPRSAWCRPCLTEWLREATRRICR